MTYQTFNTYYINFQSQDIPFFQMIEILVLLRNVLRKRMQYLCHKSMLRLCRMQEKKLTRFEMNEMGSNMFFDLERVSILRT